MICAAHSWAEFIWFRVHKCFAAVQAYRLSPLLPCLTLQESTGAAQSCSSDAYLMVVLLETKEPLLLIMHI